MFKSFFPKPGPFFLSAFIWALLAVIFWQAGGGAWLTRLTGATGDIPISAARFWSMSYLLFYAYYMLCVGLLPCSGLSIRLTAGNTGRFSARR